MNDSHIQTFRDKFEKILKQGHNLAMPYAEKSSKVKNSLSRFEKLCAERLSDLNPKLMVYGIYNAGKSTLVNALMGGEYAPIGDVPTTKAINQYNWREYTIYDTPGINAPEKDEAVSKEQLLKSDVILFVMDTAGDFSMAKNYRELAEIAKSGKRLLIVLNDKLGLDFRAQAEEVAKIEKRVYEDFATLMSGATPDELAQRFHLITVNARRALQARTREDLSDDKRAALIHASNIEALEASIVEEYEKASGLTILAQLSKMFATEIDGLSECMKELQKDVLSRQGQETLEELRLVKDRIRARVADYLHDRERVLRDNVRGILEQTSGEIALKTAIEQQAAELANAADQLLKKECEAALLKCESVIGRFESQAIDMAGGIPKMSKTPIAKIETMRSTPQEASISSVPGVKCLEATALLKGVQAVALKTLGKTAAKVVGYAIPVVNIALVAWDLISLFGGGKNDEAEQNRYNQLEAAAEAEEQRQRELARWRNEVVVSASRISRSVVTSLLDRLDGALEEIFAPIFARVTETIAANRSEEVRLVKDLESLADLKAALRDFSDIG